MLARALCLAVVLFAWPAAAARVVLPATAVPLAYRIAIVPDAAALTFAGTVAIDIRIVTATRTLTLNAADLAFTRVALSGEPAAPTIRFDPAAETVTLSFPAPLRPGFRTLTIAYTGRINRTVTGLFALDTEGAGGIPRRALYTQFETADFRRFAPSWDEPALKASFEITATLPEADRAFSNMPVAATRPAGRGRKTVRFAPSPRMSSYLVFLGIGDFERIHRTVDGVDLGVVVRRGDAEKGAYALETAARVLVNYNRYFGIRYPLPKLDLIAAPGNSQFFSAMENWGALMFFDRYLLIDPRFATESDRRRVFITIAHEMAHQWFGNLVTMAWWDDLWLNEGFANWMSAKAAAQFNPTWNVPAGELNGKASAETIDGFSGSHPLIQPIDTVLQASAAFDEITYGKGQAIVTMLEAYVGPDVWRAGVRRYIARHRYGSTVSADLWRDIDAVSPRKVTAIAHEFTRRSGVPIIGVVASAGGALRLQQAQFGGGERTWHTPVAVAGSSGARRTVVVPGHGPVRVTFDGAVLVNAGQAAYALVGYDPAAFARVRAVWPHLPVVDQVGVVLDAWALGTSGPVPVTQPLDLALDTPPDADPVLWINLLAVLGAIDRLYDGDPGRWRFHAFARRLLAPVYARVGWDAKAGEPGNEALLRAALLPALGRFGSSAVLVETRRRFAAYLQDHGSVSPAVRQVTLQVVAAAATGPEWDRLHRLAQAAETPAEQSELYNLLGTARDPALANRALLLAISGELPPAYGPALTTLVAGHHRALAFDFYVAHIEAYAAMIEPGSRQRYPADLVEGTADPELLARLRDFATDQLPSTALGYVHRTLTSGENRIALIAARTPDITAWLRAVSFAGRSPD